MTAGKKGRNRPNAQMGGNKKVGSISQLIDPAGWWALISSGWSDVGHTEFWIALAKIMWINILLSGDNAVVIAMACRGLPHRQRVWGMILGAGVAVGLRIVFTGVVASLMTLPYLKIIGGLALFYIAAKLLVPDDPDEGESEAAEHLWRAVRIVAIADIIMSLDNVIAIAAAAGGNMALLVIGLAISIPLIVAGAALIMSLLDRFPILVWAGAGLLGWIVGEVIATDPVVVAWLTAKYGAAVAHQVEIAAAVVGAILVLVVGGAWRRSKVQSESKA
ncbi:MAG: TerC family protein [Pseudolabrys sp.]|jgi:YjbE family integral membrane protein